MYLMRSRELKLSSSQVSTYVVDSGSLVLTTEHLTKLDLSHMAVFSNLLDSNLASEE